MQNTRKATLLFVALLMLCSVLLGCTNIPKEYTEGVKLDRDYPEDDMPIMDDAIIFYSDSDDEEITIEYGVNDDLDDVVDFYKDHFEDNEIALDDESDKRDKYRAEGFYQDFMFDIKVTDPSGEYEEKQFVTTVKIEIEFVDEAIENPVAAQESLEDAILGFWRLDSSDTSEGIESINHLGIACEFLASGNAIMYSDFEYLLALTWAVIDDTTISIAAPGDPNQNITIMFENRSGVEYLLWIDGNGTYYYYRDSSDEFSMNEDGIVITPDTDEGLIEAIVDVMWYTFLFSEADGTIDYDTPFTGLHNSDGTFVEVYEYETLTGTWYVENGLIYYIYDDDEVYGWTIELILKDGITYMYSYSPRDGAFWLSSDSPVN